MDTNEERALKEAKKHSDNFHGSPFDDGFHCGWQARASQESCPASGELRERANNFVLQHKEWPSVDGADLVRWLAAFAASERGQGWVNEVGGEQGKINPAFSKGYKHRHGEPVSDACGDGKHFDCDQDFTKCHCTVRSGHNDAIAPHAYMSVPAPSAGSERCPMCDWPHRRLPANFSSEPDCSDSWHSAQSGKEGGEDNGRFIRTDTKSDPTGDHRAVTSDALTPAPAQSSHKLSNPFDPECSPCAADCWCRLPSPAQGAEVSWDDQWEDYKAYVTDYPQYKDTWSSFYEGGQAAIRRLAHVTAAKDAQIKALQDNIAARVSWQKEAVAKIIDLERRFKEFTPEDVRDMAYGENALLKAEIERLKRALESCLHALNCNHNVVATDRPELPRSEETQWTTDFSKEIAQARAALGKEVKP